IALLARKGTTGLAHRRADQEPGYALRVLSGVLVEDLAGGGAKDSTGETVRDLLSGAGLQIPAVQAVQGSEVGGVAVEGSDPGTHHVRRSRVALALVADRGAGQFAVGRDVVHDRLAAVVEVLDPRHQGAVAVSGQLPGALADVAYAGPVDDVDPVVDVQE